MNKAFAILLAILALVSCTYQASWHNEYYFSDSIGMQIDGYDLQLMLNTTYKAKEGHHTTNKGPYRINLLLTKEFRNREDIHVSKLIINSMNVTRSKGIPYKFTKVFPVTVEFSEKFVGKHFNGRYPFYFHTAQFIEGKFISLDFINKEKVSIEIDLSLINQDGSIKERIKKLINFYPELREGKGRYPYLSV
ncbi:MAG: hypothetical protein GY705_16585 [Bacteroidetes bacterium]|nr:hypothetical protein [Bacteroidota bacterium]